MKERGIIMSPDEVRGLRDGSLRELRRLMRPQPTPRVPNVHPVPGWTWSPSNRSWIAWVTADEATRRALHMCPFGQPGDRLWVKETLACGFVEPLGSVSCYAIDGEPVGDAFPWRWERRTLPAAVMPRWASRWTIENTDVRVDQDGERWVWIIAIRQVQP